MNEPYSSWAARNSPEDLPLAARYQSADPIVLRGSKVYPMYTEQVGPAPTAVTVTLLSAAPPTGLRGLGMGLSVVDGYVALNGRRLAGVDVWSDALVGGISFDIIGTAPGTLVTLTPVWVDSFGEQKSWVGNYGIVIENTPDGRIVLWCSIGEGPANFANLVVEVRTAPVKQHAQPVPRPALETPLRSAPNLPTDPSGAYPSATQNSAHPPTMQSAQTNPGYAPSAQPVPLDAYSRVTQPHPAPVADPPAQPGPTPYLGSDAQYGPGVQSAPTRPMVQPATQTDEEPAPDASYRTALYDLGVAMYSRGEEDQACGLWAQAADAGHAGAAYDLGVVHFRRGDLVDAERWWRAAADRREPRAMAGLAELLDRQGNYAEARVWRACADEERSTNADQSVGSS
ncbi:tetratricopeptide repeat protein [Nocardia iowensis]|uniref:Tetratricopeptide repeat protein n=1 Tax=Nocardia iowensis TaxID=204891 RepID=A0ABX8RKE5_NOCIO|nr:tetratricopeptide repeat protein [Nocardia iowensis]QXN88905.1 tetratricopeptide repeat protein [Nocardia iowensis]